MSKAVAGWYRSSGQANGTRRYWNGSQWQGPETQIKVGESELVLSEGYSIARPLVRLAARFVDWIVWAALYVASVLLVNELAATLEDSIRRAIYIGVFAVLVALYESASVASSGRTWGKKFFDLHVVAVTDEVNTPTQVNGIKRILPWFVATVAVAVVFAFLNSGYGTLAFGALVLSLALHGAMTLYRDPNDQTTWDHFASTMVVTEND